MTGYSPLPEELRTAKPASETTRAINASLLSKLDFSDRRCFDNARRGFIASLEEVIIPHDNGSRPAYDLEALKFLENEAPDTVNPSLWRMAQLSLESDRFDSPQQITRASNKIIRIRSISSPIKNSGGIERKRRDCEESN